MDSVVSRGGDGEICPLFDWAAPSYLGKGQQPPLENLIIYIRFNINSTCLWQSCPPDTEEGGGWCPSFPNTAWTTNPIVYIYIYIYPACPIPLLLASPGHQQPWYVLTLLSQNMPVSTPKVFGAVSSEGSYLSSITVTIMSICQKTVVNCNVSWTNSTWLTQWGQVMLIWDSKTWPSLLQLMAWHLFGTKPLSEAMLDNC